MSIQAVHPNREKRSKAKTTTAILLLKIIYSFVMTYFPFNILASSNSELHLKIKESLLIVLDKPELNKNEKSLPLDLF